MRHRVRNQRDHLQTLLPGPYPLRSHAILHHKAQVEGNAFQAQFSGLNLRQVQNVVQQRQQRMRAALRRLQLVALLRAQPRIQHQVNHPDNAIHRRPQLMRHIGQKLALGGAGLHGVFHRRLQRNRPLLNSPFQFALMRRNLALRFLQSLDHLVEAMPHKLDLVIGLINLNRTQFALLHFQNALA